MDQNAFDELLQAETFSWYRFDTGKRLLVIGYEDDRKPYHFSEDLIVTGITLRDIWEDENGNHLNGAMRLNRNVLYDYIIVTDAIERCEDPVKLLFSCRKLMASHGRLLLGVHNRLGLKYFCGDTGPYGTVPFGELEGEMQGSPKERCGRCFDRYEWLEMLANAGFEKRCFFSIWPDIDAVQLVYADGIYPEEELLGRYIPRYRNPEGIVMWEEKVVNGISHSPIFHALANGFVIETTVDGELSGIRSATISASRGRRYAESTVIYENHTVEKKALFEEGIAGIHRLHANIKDLAAHGIDVVDGELFGNVYVMPFVKGKTADIYFRELLLKDKDAFLQLLDTYRELIMMSSEHEDTEDGEIVLKKGYIDLVPLNAFWLGDKFVFFDQEYMVEKLPANVILYRSIVIIYNDMEKLNAILPIGELWERYGLSKHMDVYIQYEQDFLNQIRDKEDNGKDAKLSLRNDTSTAALRVEMGGMHKFMEAMSTCFHGLGDKIVFLFGSGKYGKEFVKRYKDKYQIERILDNNEDRWGDMIDGIPIDSVESIVGEQRGYKVIICAKDYKAMYRQLDRMQVMHIGIFVP